MKNLRNKNHPPKADIVQNYLESAWDVVYEVYRQLANIETVGDAINNGTLDDFLSAADIDTIAKLNAILTDATLGDFATQAEAEAGVNNTKTMTPLRVAQAIAVLAAGIQNNFNATADPGVNDDSNAGYSVGSVWINQTPTPPEAFRCADPSPGTAVWIKTSLTIDELAVVALSGNSDDLIEGVTQLLMTVAERDKLTNIEPMATADQTPAEIEAGYNAQVAVVTQLEAEAGALTTVKRWTPERVKQAIQALSTGGLAWSSANSSIAVAKSTGTVFYALPATVTATLPANPAVGDSLMIVNNDNNALDAYNVNVTAGGSNEIRQQNVVMIPQATVVQGETALFVCYDAGATKRWHMQKWVSSLDIGAGGGVNALFKTGAYTASAGDIVGVGSDTAAITITLPASPSTDDYVAIWDADDNAGTNTITVGRNGNTIDGVAADFEINIDGGRVDLIYNGTTWKVAYTTPGASGIFQSGTFTPTLWDNSNSDAESQAYATQTGLYRKVGDMVTIWIDLQLSSLGTLLVGDGARIGNLPFTPNGDIAAWPLTVSYAGGLAITAGVTVAAYAASDAARITLTKFSDTTGTSILTIAEFSADGRVILSGSYLAAS